MPDNFYTLNASFAKKIQLPNGDVRAPNVFDHLVAALGKMLGGGMVPDGTRLDLGSGTFALASIQALLSEVGCEMIAMGLSPDHKGDSTFVAMSDGSIWRTQFISEMGGLNWECWKATAQECTDNCAAADLYSDGIKAVVTKELAENGTLKEGDAVQGHIFTDCHAAICMRMKGHGSFIISADGQEPRAGVKFTIDAPRPNCSYEDAKATLVLKNMDAESIKSEASETKKNLGMTNPFPTTWGQA